MGMYPIYCPVSLGGDVELQHNLSSPVRQHELLLKLIFPTSSQSLVLIFFSIHPVVAVVGAGTGTLFPDLTRPASHFPTFPVQRRDVFPAGLPTFAFNDQILPRLSTVRGGQAPYSSETMTQRQSSLQ